METFNTTPLKIIQPVVIAGRTFAPHHLTVARQRRKRTMRSLAESVRVTPMAITRYEQGTLNPSEESVQALANELSMPVPFFYDADADAVEHESVSFRARRAMTATVRDKTLATGYLAAVTLSPAFSQRFAMPSLDLPDLSEFAPTVAAGMLRARWRMGNEPIPNIIRLLEKHGIEIYWMEEESPSVDAVSFWRDRKPFILMNLTDKSGDRCRFNAAHELGHLVLHRESEVLDGREIEEQANKFASAFLMPAEQFFYECPKTIAFGTFRDLKHRWRVSIQAMIRRGRDLGIYKESQYERAFRDIAIKGWRTEEPYGFPCEESVLHHQIYSIMSDKGECLQQFADFLHLNLEEDLLELTPVAKRFMSRPKPMLEERTTPKLPRSY